MKKGRIDGCISSVTAETTMPYRSSSSSPAETVVSIDDLLTGILLRLPVRSLLHFKSVAKHWYSLITSPSFKLLRSRNPDPPSGLFVAIKRNKTYFEFVSFDIENPVKAPFTTPNFDPNVTEIDIEHSCNGLMLCSSRTYDLRKEEGYVAPDQYYVYNPTINQFITLPRVENFGNSAKIGRHMAIAFDPSKSSDYRIVCVCELGNDYVTGGTNCQIEIFSSKTRTWKPSCKFPFVGSVYLYFKGGVYWNNAIHWILEGYVFYFNLDEESIHEKQTPLRLLGLGAAWSRIFESQDQLLLVEFELISLNTKIKIHELKRDYSGWSVKYNVDIHEVGGSFPEIKHPRLPIKFEFMVLCIVLGEKEEDSFLVLEVTGKAVRFNLATKTFHKLHDFPVSRYIKPNCVFSAISCVYPLVESLYSC